MKLTCFMLALAISFSAGATAELPIDVTDQTLKIGGLKEEILYFGFAAGDRILFSFSEADGKELKEVEVIECPSASKFSDFKTAKIEEKTIIAAKKAVYKFRFYNGAVGGRICKIRIQRVPSGEQTRNFLTHVNWVTKQDTSWNVYTKDVIVGYDTSYVPKTKRELVKTTQAEELIFDKTQRVHSITNEYGNKTSLFFSLPDNTVTLYRSTRVIAWAYWVGVGEEASQAWSQNIQAVGGLVRGAANFVSPLGALAVGAVTELMIPKIGEDVYYAVTSRESRDQFLAGETFSCYDNGKGVAGYRKFSDVSLCQGAYFICLSNDNNFQGIDATVKVIAIIETKIYEDKEYKEEVVTPKLEKQIFRDPVIVTTRFPVTAE